MGYKRKRYTRKRRPTRKFKRRRVYKRSTVALRRRKVMYRKKRAAMRNSPYKNSLGISRRRILSWKQQFTLFDLRHHQDQTAITFFSKPLVIDPTNIYNPLGLEQPTSAGTLCQTETDFRFLTGETKSVYRPCTDHDDYAKLFKSYMVDSCTVVVKFVVPELKTGQLTPVQALGCKLFASTEGQPYVETTMADFVRHYGPFTMFDTDRTKQAVLKKTFVPYRGASVGKYEREQRLKDFGTVDSVVPSNLGDCVNIVWYLPQYQNNVTLITQVSVEIYYNVFLEGAIHTEDNVVQFPL